jgi:cobalt/nickel transport system permease protein
LENYKIESSDIPEWLLQDDNYTPQSDRDTFVNKSILSIFAVLSRVKAQDVNHQGKLRVNTVFKVACTLMLVLLISMSRKYTFVMIANVYLIVVLSTLEARIIINILKVSLVMAAFTYVILLPATLMGNSYSGLMITSKVFATITAVNILSHSTRWHSITSALKRFYVPDLFIFVFDITIKYIVLLGELAVNLLYALRLRSVGKNKSKYTSLSGIAGTIFLKSKEMAEDMNGAMICRGFTGEYHVGEKISFTFYDFAYIMIHIVLVALYFCVGRV